MFIELSIYMKKFNCIYSNILHTYLLCKYSIITHSSWPWVCLKSQFNGQRKFIHFVKRCQITTFQRPMFPSRVESPTAIVVTSEYTKQASQASQECHKHGALEDCKLGQGTRCPTVFARPSQVVIIFLRHCLWNNPEGNSPYRDSMT